MDTTHQLASSEIVSKVQVQLMGCLPDYVGLQKETLLTLKLVACHCHQWDLVFLNFLRFPTH